MKVIEAKSRQVYCPEENNFDMGKQRVTDCPNNTRVFLPKPMSAMDEAMWAVRVSEWNKVRDWFKANNTNAKGEQKPNLSPSKLRGLKSLLLRVKEGLIVIVQTDKTGKFAIMSMEDYLAAGKVHTDKDECVGVFAPMP